MENWPATDTVATKFRCTRLAWVAQATHLRRRVTRPTQWGTVSVGTGLGVEMRVLQFRPASRWTGRRVARIIHAKHMPFVARRMLWFPLILWGRADLCIEMHLAQTSPHLKIKWTGLSLVGALINGNALN